MRARVLLERFMLSTVEQYLIVAILGGAALLFLAYVVDEVRRV
jgi:hypothetical protein